MGEGQDTTETADTSPENLVFFYNMLSSKEKFNAGMKVNLMMWLMVIDFLTFHNFILTTFLPPIFVIQKNSSRFQMERNRQEVISIKTAFSRPICFFPPPPSG
jgi:hypothetical protein